MDPQTKKQNIMKKHIKQTNPLCAVCGGPYRSTTITHEERHGESVYLFRNVPAYVCSECGEMWVEERTLQQIDRLIETGTPTYKVETPVYEFSGVK